MLASWIAWMGNAFSPEQYVFWTRIECTAWTLADVVIVFYLLRIGDLARAAARRERHRVSYVVLAATLPPAAVIPLEPGGQFIFLIEVLVTVAHFLIILYALAADAALYKDLFLKLVRTEPLPAASTTTAT
jgi:hypothetical protein